MIHFRAVVSTTKSVNTLLGGFDGEVVRSDRALAVFFLDPFAQFIQREVRNRPRREDDPFAAPDAGRVHNRRLDPPFRHVVEQAIQFVVRHDPTPKGVGRSVGASQCLGFSGSERDRKIRGNLFAALVTDLPRAEHHSMPAMPELLPDENGTFQIRNWQVFAPGFLKGRLYTMADCWRAVDTFQRLSKDVGGGKTADGKPVYLRAKVRLGHDPLQSLALSMGLPNAGQIADCRKTAEGFAVDLRRIPCKVPMRNRDTQEFELFDLQAALENGHYNDGSVEFIWDLPDRDNPGVIVQGPVLDAVALLGEEQPAVKGQSAPFVAQRRDAFANSYVEVNGVRCTVTRIAFAEMRPMNYATMNRAQLLAALQTAGIDPSNPAIAGKSDDDLRAMLTQGQGDQFAALKTQFSAPPPAAGATVPAAPVVPATGAAPDMTSFMSEARTAFSQLATFGQRLGSVESAVQAMQPVASQMTAMSQDFETQHKANKLATATERVNAASKAGKVSPYLIQSTIDRAMEHSDHARDTFAAGHARASLTPFRAFLADIDARPADDRMTPLPLPQTGKTGTGTPSKLSDVSPYAQRALEQDPQGRSVAAALAKAG